MSSEHLARLAESGSLTPEPRSESEFRGLIESAIRRLADAGKASNALESRFDLAYNASHALALAALRWHGYRSGSRYLVFQCLKHTLDMPSEQWRVLDQAHRKRNLIEYQGDAEIDAALVEAMIRVARDLHLRLQDLPSIEGE